MTNGKTPFVEADGRGLWARRWRDVLAEIISDLGGHDGGLSEGQRQLARRAATISIACEKMEGEAAAGNEIDLEEYGRLTDRLGRAFQRLGLERRPRDVTPSLTEYLRAARAAAGDAEPDAVPPMAVSPRIARNELPGVQMPGDAESAAVSEIGDHGGQANEGGAA